MYLMSTLISFGTMRMCELSSFSDIRRHTHGRYDSDAYRLSLLLNARLSWALGTADDLPQYDVAYMVYWSEANGL